MRVKNILFSQNPPQNFDKSPYAELTKKYNVKVHFFKFFQSEEISVEQYRKKRINLDDYPAIIMTSKKVIDHFFSVMDKMKITVPSEQHFYCVNEAVAYYLQKYIVFRKRKVFYGNGDFEDLIRVMEENNEKRYLFPCAVESGIQPLCSLMDEREVKYKKVEIYRIVYKDLHNIDLSTYDLIVFFSPHGIESLKASYPDFVQGDTYIGVLGTQVLEMAQKENLRIDLQAPTLENPSIISAIDQLLQKTNGRKR